MKNFTIKKIFIWVFTLIIVFFANTMSVDASDYKYKVLDPKYNPAAERLINGELVLLSDDDSYSSKTSFDYAQFFAILATMLLPWILLSFAIKSFRTIMDKGFKTDEEIYNQAFGTTEEAVSEQVEPETSNGKIPPKSEVKKDIEKFIKENEIIKKAEVQLNQIEEKENNEVVDFSDLALSQVTSGNSIKNAIDEKVVGVSSSSLLMTDAISKNSKVISDNIDRYLRSQNSDTIQSELTQIDSNVVTPSVTKKSPNLLNTAPLTKSKGLCLVQYGKKYSLIGYIGKKVFLIRQFDNLESTEIRPRLTETKENRDKYIVRLGSYKAMVSVTDRDIKLLLEL